MGRQVLVVDDETHIRRIIEIQLARSGYSVDCAADGQEAYEMIQENLPDLVITDFQMPRMDGLSLCERLAQEESTRHIPIFLLTAKGFEIEEEKILAHGNVVEILCKPFSPVELRRKVAKALVSQGQP